MDSRTLDWEALSAEYRENGCALLPQLLDAETMAKYKKVYQETLENPSQVTLPFQGKKDYTGPGASYNVATGLRGPIEVYQDLLESTPVLLEALKTLWGSKNVWFYDHELFRKLYPNTTSTGFHQDTVLLPFDGPDLAVVWVTFESVPQKNSIECVRGSVNMRSEGGRLPYMNQREVGKIESEREKWDLVSWATKPGDVVVFHPGSIHGGGAVTADFPERNTLCLRFFGDNATFRAIEGKNAKFSSGKRFAGMKTGDPFSNAKRVLHLSGPGALGSSRL